jgi:hypothetical protein
MMNEGDFPNADVFQQPKNRTRRADGACPATGSTTTGSETESDAGAQWRERVKQRRDFIERRVD